MAPVYRGCVNCKHRLRPNEITYNVTDLDSGIIKVVEETIGREAKVHDWLCSICFTAVIQPNDNHEESVVAITDPLVDDTEIKQYISSEEEVEDVTEVEVEIAREAEVAEVTEVEDVDEPEVDEPEDVNEPEDIDEPAVNLQSRHCVVCSETLTEKQSLPLPIGPERDAVENQIFPKKLSRHSVICKDCFEASKRGIFCIFSTEKLSASRNIESKESTKPTATIKSQAMSDLIHVPNYYMVRGSRKCFVKNCTNAEARKTLPSDLRRILLENYNLFLSSTCNVCLEHRKEYYKNWNLVIDKKLHEQKFTSAEVEEMLGLLSYDA